LSNIDLEEILGGFFEGLKKTDFGLKMILVFVEHRFRRDFGRVLGGLKKKDFGLKMILVFVEHRFRRDFGWKKDD
jgi:hypothetical protein